jgi:uncharacterized protein YjbJ (UPF0337 family)
MQPGAGWVVDGAAACCRDKEKTMVDENRVQGAWDQAKGAVKETVGKMTGDAKLKGEGIADKATGKAESAVGGVKDTMRDAADKV